MFSRATLIAAASALAGPVMRGLGPNRAHGHPNPCDPGYCGAREDALDPAPYDSWAPRPIILRKPSFCVGALRRPQFGGHDTTEDRPALLQHASWRHLRQLHPSRQCPPTAYEHQADRPSNRDGQHLPQMRVGVNCTDDFRPYHWRWPN